MKADSKPPVARKLGFNEPKKRNPRHKNFKQSRDMREDRGTVQSRFGPRQQTLGSGGARARRNGPLAKRVEKSDLSSYPAPRKGQAELADAKKRARSGARKARLKLLRILVPIDFSKWSAGAVNYAGALAAEFGGEVILLHVVEKLTFPGDTIAPLWSKEYFAEGQQAILARLRLLSETLPAKTRHSVLFGRAWVEICNAARDERCDLIVLCKHGSPEMRQAFLGSVAEKVVRHAPCAVLALKPRGRGLV